MTKEEFLPGIIYAEKITDWAGGRLGTANQLHALLREYEVTVTGGIGESQGMVLLAGSESRRQRAVLK